MKVCVVTTSYPRYEGDFAGAFLSHICNELGKLGIDVSVVAPNDTESIRYEQHSNVTVRRFNYFAKRYQNIAYGYGGILVNLKNNPWLVFLLPFFVCSFFVNVFKVARHCDLIHVNWIPTGYMCTVIKLILRKPLILTIRGKDISLFQNKRRSFSLLSRIFFPHIDLFTTVSNEFADFLRNENLVKPETVSVVPNGVSDIETETEYLKRHKRQHGIPQDGLKAIYVGSLIKLKGIRWLMHAWKLVVKEYPTAKLLIIGDGDDRKNLESMAEELNLQENTIFYGYQPTHTIPYWLACADIFVLPSHFEGRPNVLLEAFQGQLPVVASNIPGIRELVQDRVNGFLVPGEDPKALADNILKLFSSGKLRKKMGKAGKELIRARGLTWKNCAEKYYKLYKHLLT
jgi:glycosyltransferase involved in cell wall biosynthesis